MNILNNFVNPWESSGVLGSQALGTEVLEGNVLEEGTESPIPLAVINLYIHNETMNEYKEAIASHLRLSDKKIEKIISQIRSIYRKNEINIAFNIKKIATIKEVLEIEDKLNVYDLFIAIKAGGYQGLTTFDGYNNSLILIDKNTIDPIFEDTVMTTCTYANYESALNNSSKDITDIFIVAYYAAHELWHQLLGKAEVYFDKKRITEHTDSEPNLNMKGDLALPLLKDVKTVNQVQKILTPQKMKVNEYLYEAVINKKVPQKWRNW